MALALHYGFVCEYNDTHDALTGLCNRKSYEREMERLQKGKRFAVVVMDVDDFKNVNDRCGHPYGDQCLNKLASLIQQAFEKIGTCYRIGGDEFCVLSRTEEEDKIQDALSRLMRGIEACRAQDPFLPVVSYGVRMSGQGESAVETIQAADRQMYFHKAQHKRETAL
jgi:diguanylate cyclase (GGDEF)-like protein